MENNIWRGFTKEEQHLYHRVEERDGQVEDNLSDTIQVGYEIVLERMESSLASICKLLKEGKVEDARKLYETIFSYYSEDADLWLEVEFLKRALPIVAQIRSRKDTLDWISSIVQEDIKDLEAILRKRYRVFEDCRGYQRLSHSSRARMRDTGRRCLPASCPSYTAHISGYQIPVSRCFRIQ